MLAQSGEEQVRKQEDEMLAPKTLVSTGDRSAKDQNL